MTSDKCMHHIITTTVKTYISITPKQFPCTPLQSIFTTPSPRGPLFCLLSLKINYTFLELHINGIIEHLLFCVLFFFFWNRISQITEQLLQRSMVFSTVLYLVRTKNIKQVRDTFLQSFKKKADQYIHSESLWPWHLGRESHHRRSTSTGIPKGRHLIFIFNMDIISGQCTLFFNNYSRCTMYV